MARGEYRAIHTVIVDTPEFQALSRDAQLAWFHLKLRLGPTGIDTMPAAEAQLAEGIEGDTHTLSHTHTHTHGHGLAEALRELVKGGWLLREGPVLWLRNALRFEPGLTPTNEKHRTSILRHLEGLPKLPIVNQFAEYYDLPLPFPDVGVPGTHPHTLSHTLSDTPTDTPSDGYALQEEGGREEGRGKTSPTESDDSSGLGASTDAPSPNGSAPKEPTLRERYPAKPPKRKGQFVYPEEFEAAWGSYPARDGPNPKAGAYKAWRARVVDGEDPSNLQEAAEHYAEHCTVREIEGTSYVQQAETFFGPREPFREFVEGARLTTAGAGTDEAKAQRQWEALERQHGVS